MPEGTGTGASTAATAGSGATPTTGAQGKSGDQTAKAGDSAAGDQSQQTDQLGEGGQAAIEREREAAREAKRQLKETQAALKQLQEKDLPEAEKSAREHAETKAANETLARENNQLKAQLAVYSEASRLGFADPMDAFRLVDVEFDDDGKPKKVVEALTKLLNDKPYLKSGTARAASGGSADAGNTNGQPSGGSSMNDLIRQAAGRG